MYHKRLLHVLYIIIALLFLKNVWSTLPYNEKKLNKAYRVSYMYVQHNTHMYGSPSVMVLLVSAMIRISVHVKVLCIIQESYLSLACNICSCLYR